MANEKGTSKAAKVKPKMREEWEALAKAHSEVRVFIEFAHANQTQFQSFLMWSLGFEVKEAVE